MRTMPDPPDSHGTSGEQLSELLIRSSRGEEEAWRGLIGIYGRRVYAMARSRCRRDDLAEEITQSVFVTVASKLGSGGYVEQGRFEAWLFRVTMNRIRDEARRQKRHAVPTDPATLVDAPDQHHDGVARHAAVGDDDLRALRTAMNSLNDSDREIIELRHHASLSFKQISEILEEPMGTILARHHRALRKLRESIGGSPFEPEEREAAGKKKEVTE